MEDQEPRYIGILFEHLVTAHCDILQSGQKGEHRSHRMSNGTDSREPSVMEAVVGHGRPGHCPPRSVVTEELSCMEPSGILSTSSGVPGPGWLRPRRTKRMSDCMLPRVAIMIFLDLTVNRSVSRIVHTAPGMMQKDNGNHPVQQQTRSWTGIRYLRHLPSMISS